MGALVPTTAAQEDQAGHAEEKGSRWFWHWSGVCLQDEGRRGAGVVTCRLCVIQTSKGAGGAIFDAPFQSAGHMPGGLWKEPVISRCSVGGIVGHERPLKSWNQAR